MDQARPAEFCKDCLEQDCERRRPISEDYAQTVEQHSGGLVLPYRCPYDTSSFQPIWHIQVCRPAHVPQPA